MSETFICAIERTEKPNQVRRDGFVPAVVYGKEIEGTKSVQFNARELKALLRGRTVNANIQVKVDGNIERGIVKEIQRDAISAEIIHLDVQAVSAKEILRLRVPITFDGRDNLIAKDQMIQIFISDVEIMGEAAKIPEVIHVDISNKEIGDKIEIEDLNLDTGLEVMDDISEGFAMITEIEELKVESEEEDVEGLEEDGETEEQEDEAETDQE